MVKPSANIAQRIQLRVVCKNDSASSETAWLLHDWAPIAQQLFKVASTRTIASCACSDDFLWDDSTKRVSLFGGFWFYSRRNLRVLFHSISVFKTALTVRATWFVAINIHIYGLWLNPCWFPDHKLIVFIVVRNAHRDYLTCFPTVVKNDAVGVRLSDSYRSTKLFC